MGLTNPGRPPPLSFSGTGGSPPAAREPVSFPRRSLPCATPWIENLFSLGHSPLLRPLRKTSPSFHPDGSFPLFSPGELLSFFLLRLSILVFFFVPHGGASFLAIYSSPLKSSIRPSFFPFEIAVHQHGSGSPFSFRMTSPLFPASLQGFPCIIRSCERMVFSFSRDGIPHERIPPSLFCKRGRCHKTRASGRFSFLSCELPPPFPSLPDKGHFSGFSDYGTGRADRLPCEDNWIFLFLPPFVQCCYDKPFLWSR